MKELLKKILQLLALICTFPLAMIFRLSQSSSLFAGQAQLLALVPGKAGSYLRVAYYCQTLKRCSSHGYIGFGTFFSQSEAELGLGYYIGSYCILGKAVLENHVTIGSGVNILSGKHQHGYAQIGVPIQEQSGEFIKVRIGENCWIGNGAIIMADLGLQNVIAAGSVVTSRTEDFSLMAGNPAKLAKKIF
ncbi:MAG: hypothetical protein BM485_07875 [Desulfobulbaceae bacterium DB1]|nr:MAG: hypothetical protein BM485_07875 [Desulfobulbaceae bacterium DB1]